MSITRINANQGGGESIPKGHSANVSPDTGLQVTFDEPMSSVNYPISVNCYTTIEGQYSAVTYSVTNKTINGFKVYPSELASVDWWAGTSHN